MLISFSFRAMAFRYQVLMLGGASIPDLEQPFTLTTLTTEEASLRPITSLAHPPPLHKRDIVSDSVASFFHINLELPHQ